MRESVGKVLLALCIGAIAGWFARDTLRDRAYNAFNKPKITSNAPTLNRDEHFSATSRLPGTSTQSSEVRKSAPTNAAMTASNSTAASLGIDGLQRSGDHLGSSLGSPSSGTDSNATRPDSDNGTQRSPLQELLNSSGITCTFGAGNSAEWPNGKIRIGGSAWQGGPVDFESIDIGAGSAQMTGSGATRLQGASVGVTVAPTDSGLNFSGVVGHGTLVVTTVFSGLDAAGHHIAVMSSHGLVGLESAQFYGTCDTASQNAGPAN